jgi:hypothetical protein
MLMKRREFFTAASHALPVVNVSVVAARWWRTKSRRVCDMRIGLLIKIQGESLSFDSQ